jgi:class 3 adenylate cyclase
MAAPQVRYCTASDGVRIAYTVTGSGPPLVNVTEPAVSHVELEWSHPVFGRMWPRLAERTTLIRFDERRTGLSDRETQPALPPYLDLEGVVAKVGLGRFALVAAQSASPGAIMYAALNPERVTHLVLLDGILRVTDLLGTPQVQAMVAAAAADFTMATEAIGAAALGVGRDEVKDYGEYIRKCIGPEFFDTARAVEYDASDFAPKVAAPTLVLRHTGLQYVTMEMARELAAAIPDSTLTTVGGMWADDIEGVADRVLDFVLGGPEAETESDVPAATVSGPSVATVLFTDLVGHTEMMSRLGDERGREVLREHERITREVLAEHGGTEVKTMGDGFMASFGSVTKAVECAIALQRAFASHDGEPLSIRVGLNAGEPIEEDGDLFGATVILASRIAAKAEGGEILVADTVRGLCSGKGFLFSDRGEFVAKGFEEPVRVYEVRWRESE